MGIFDFFFQKKSRHPLPLYLVDILGYNSGDIELYEKAFTHKSYNNSVVHNERLEYLGDAIIDAVVSEFLFEKFPNMAEGELTKARSFFVSRENLTKTALSMGIDKYIKSNIGGGKQSKSIYGNAFEALVGAVFTDKDYDISAQFVKKYLLSGDIDSFIQHSVDYKSVLLEWSQKEKVEVTFNTQLNNNSHGFVTALLIENNPTFVGEGNNKKAAEKAAAEKAVKELELHENGSYQT